MKVDEILSVGGLPHRPPALRVLEFREGKAEKVGGAPESEQRRRNGAASGRPEGAHERLLSGQNARVRGGVKIPRSRHRNRRHSASFTRRSLRQFPLRPYSRTDSQGALAGTPGAGGGLDVPRAVRAKRVSSREPSACNGLLGSSSRRRSSRASLGSAPSMTTGSADGGASLDVAGAGGRSSTMKATQRHLPPTRSKWTRSPSPNIT